MKKILLFIATTLCFVACNKIEGPYLSQSMQEDVEVEFPELDPSKVYRKILFDEYTGHTCQNCPNGHAILNQLLEQYGDTLVAACIHAGDLAEPDPSRGFTYDFRTPTGNQLYNDYGQPLNPGAIINRTGGAVYGENTWRNSVKNADRSLYAAIQIINQYDDVHQKLKINTKTTILEDYDQPVQLSLLLVEDSIVKPQLFSDHVDNEYVHNHVLRAGINGNYGEYISPNGLVSKNDEYFYGYSLEFYDHDWVPERCYVIALLLDASSRKVLQVEKVKVK